MLESIRYTPDSRYLRISTIDAHTQGEPFRIILRGVPQPEGATILEKRQYAMDRLDHFRRILMFEPRGHADMYGCIVTPPATDDADFGILFMHNAGFSTMCGHGIIAIATVAAEIGFIPVRSARHMIRIDTPAGRVTAFVNMAGFGTAGMTVDSVSFENVPCFAPDLDREIHVPGLGMIRYDLGFGGAFYAYVRAEDIGLACTPGHVNALIDAGRKIKQAVTEQRSIVHPADPALSFLYGVIFHDTPDIEGVHSRHTCIFADGEVDRSPTGTGVSGRLAILHKKGDIRPGQDITIHSIINSGFSGRVLKETRVEGIDAVIPEVTGKACITGMHEFLVDPDDPLQPGFLLR